MMLTLASSRGTILPSKKAYLLAIADFLLGPRTRDEGPILDATIIIDAVWPVGKETVHGY
jgi:hypothetical protein